ncbi:G-D-S-L family lipolytic protein [Phragmitibacter flavus]|uniref:G-D-S-L family lipolytic protein n=1 Tax=Phragmitibacter flavus TaxID=2576071 RepID=A0A5R8KET9_9BACT|nr:GDSL-type esterase/lipase family protein [Phragmitibacter flavus]TLD70810.1 G-D-S-L family lipolytic protein [Phragmitibacter flavus]
MKRLRTILALSLVLNLLFLGAGVIFVHKKGGVSYLLAKILPSSRSELRAPSYFDSPAYQARANTYAVLPPQEATIIFAGDSITDFCPWNELLRRPALNRGIAGDTIEGLRHRLDKILQHHPKQLFLMIGINDLRIGRPSSEVMADYRNLVVQIQTTSPQTQLFLQSVLPINSDVWRSTTGMNLSPAVTQSIKEFNTEMATIADGQKIIYIDLYSTMVSNGNQLDPRYTSDGIHLNGSGYLKWHEVLQRYLP